MRPMPSSRSPCRIASQRALRASTRPYRGVESRNGLDNLRPFLYASPAASQRIMGDSDTARPHTLRTPHVTYPTRYVRVDTPCGRAYTGRGGRSHLDGLSGPWSSRSVRRPRAHRLLRGNVERRQRLRPGLPGLRVDSKWLNPEGFYGARCQSSTWGGRVIDDHARPRMVFDAPSPLWEKALFLCPVGARSEKGSDGRRWTPDVVIRSA